MKQKRHPGFQQCMKMMRQQDPQAQEDGFHFLLPHVSEHVADLIREFNDESYGHGIRCWILDLIGRAESPAAFDFFVEQLHSRDVSFAAWAATGLGRLGTRQARQVLWDAQDIVLPSEGETEYLRQEVRKALDRARGT